MFGLSLKRKSKIPETSAEDSLQVVATSGNVITLAKPQPIAVTFDELADLSEYEEVAAILNFAPPQIAEQKRERLRRELIGFMLDHGMPIYDNKEVHAYMAKLAEKADKAFVWVMLRQPWPNLYSNTTNTTEDTFGRFRWGSQQDQALRDALRRQMNASAGLFDGMGPVVREKAHGQLVDGPYGHPVPLDILKRAATVKKQFPQAEIYVSDYAVVNPDPFIMAKIGDCEHVVFGVWDEPGFGAIGRDRK